ncbi:MAG: NAD(P)/FAD-dependent oxidoreductase [Deltaproteobacteria bacterium]|nr:NAD(P)/FAD-dependent oxidoreductase [Deltaproteobacteria bacterium]
MAKTYKYDVVVIGGGPNGLVLAAYLSKAGAKVIVLEKSYETGGGLATEDLTIPGFIHNSHAVYHMMVDYAPPYEDFELEKRRDVRYIYPDLQFAMPLSDGRCVCIYKDIDRTCRSLEQFSRRDAEAWREVSEKCKRYMDDFLAPATYAEAVPPLDEAVRLEKSESGRELMSFSAKSPKEIVNELFENEHVKALMSYVICHWGLVYEQDGVGYMALLLLNRATNYRLCVHGSHRLASALSREIMENGGQIRTSVLVRKIIVQDGRAAGVEMDDGTIYEAERAVVSSIDPHQTFLKLVDKRDLDKEFVEKIEGWKWERWSLQTVHLAMDGAPNFAAAVPDSEINRSMVYVIGYETVDDLLRHWESIERGEVMEGAGFNCCFPGLHDPSQAPEGRVTAYISQMAPYQIKGGVEKWYKRDFRQEQIEKCIETLSKYAPGIRNQVLWSHITTPLDVENKLLDMRKGSIKQGAYHPFQMGYHRPNADCSHHRTPIKNLYLCGACTHPGGLVTFGPGYLAANRVAEDLGIEKWWAEPEMVTRARKKGLL